MKFMIVNKEGKNAANKFRSSSRNSKMEYLISIQTAMEEGGMVFRIMGKLNSNIILGMRLYFGLGTLFFY